MNPLTDIIPAHWRKRVYVLYALAGLLVGVLTVAGVATGTAPDVLTYLGVALGLTAASNTAPPADPPVDPEGGHSNLDTLLIGLLCVFVLLLLLGHRW